MSEYPYRSVDEYLNDIHNHTASTANYMWLNLPGYTTEELTPADFIKTFLPAIYKAEEDKFFAEYGEDVADRYDEEHYDAGGGDWEYEAWRDERLWHD